MKLPLALVALSLIGAGCLSAADLDAAGVVDDATQTAGYAVHGVGGKVLDASALPTTLLPLAGGAFHTGVAASEPTIGVTSDGAVFMTGSVPNGFCEPIPGGCPAVPYAGLQRGPTIMRSMDKGQTWEDVFQKLPTGDGFKVRSWDPYVYVDRLTDRVFMDDIYPLGCGFMSWSDDRGESWMHNPAACGNPQLNDHQTVGTGIPRALPVSPLYPNIVYRCVNNGAITACAISLTGGQTFLPQIPVAPESGCGGITGHLESDGEGRVYLPMSCNGDPAVAVTEDDGQTWTMHTIAEGHGLHGLHVDMAVDEANNVYALWESEYLPWLSVSVDHGATWSEPVMVGAPDVTMIKFNAIAAGAAGKVAFAYVGTTIADASKLPPSECGALPALPCSEPKEWATATWNAYVGVIEDALAPELVIQTTTANDPADPLARGTCGGRCNGMTDFIDIAIDVEGRPWASFVDVCVEACVTDPSVLFDGNLGLAASLVRGPALRGELKELAPIAPPVA